MSTSVLIGLVGVLILVIFILMFRVQGLLSVARGSDKKPGGLLNKVNASMFLIFAIAGTALFLWYSFAEYDNYTLPTASSVHGVKTDELFWVTTVIISIVFIVTNVLLFGFAFKYQHKEGRKAKFYPDNHVLELVWTVIPAIVLTYLVFNGWKEWTKIMNEPPAQLTENKVEFEIVGQQFAWSVRYPGENNELGDHYFRDIDATNSFGIKPTDEQGWDDIVVRKIYLPVNRLTHVKIRAKDVLHSVYMPHFRVKMDAVPGMPTDFWFTPTVTTREMRNELGNQEFEYELACTEMCGKGHFSMRYIIVVVEEEEYEEWLEDSYKNAWAVKESGYVFEKLFDQGASKELKTKFISWGDKKDESFIQNIIGHINGISQTDPEKSKLILADLQSVLSSMGKSTKISSPTENHNSNDLTSDIAIEGDSLSNGGSEGDSLSGSLGEEFDLETEEGKKKRKNLLHKIGDKIEDGREKRAEKRGEEYERKDNGLHKLGDKHEDKK